MLMFNWCLIRAIGFKPGEGLVQGIKAFAEARGLVVNEHNDLSVVARSGGFTVWLDDECRGGKFGQSYGFFILIGWAMQRQGISTSAALSVTAAVRAFRVVWFSVRASIHCHSVVELNNPGLNVFRIVFPSAEPSVCYNTVNSSLAVRCDCRVAIPGALASCSLILVSSKLC